MFVQCFIAPFGVGLLAEGFLISAVTVRWLPSSKYSVIGTSCPSCSAAFRSISMMWLPLGFSWAWPLAGTGIADTARIFITPLSLMCVCNSTVPAIALSARSNCRSAVLVLSRTMKAAEVMAPGGTRRT